MTLLQQIWRSRGGAGAQAPGVGTVLRRVRPLSSPGLSVGSSWSWLCVARASARPDQGIWWLCRGFLWCCARFVWWLAPFPGGFPWLRWLASSGEFGGRSGGSGWWTLGGSSARLVAAVLVVVFGRVGDMDDGGWRSWRGPARASFLAQMLIWRLCYNYGVPCPSRWGLASVTSVDG